MPHRAAIARIQTPADAPFISAQRRAAAGEVDGGLVVVGDAAGGIGGVDGRRKNVEQGAEMRLGCVVADVHGTGIEQGSDTLPPFGGRDAIVPWAIAVCNHEMSSQTESKQTGARRRHPANVGLGRLFPSSPYLRYVFIFVRIVQTEAADFFLPNGLLDELLLITAPSRKVRKRETEEACEMMPRRRQYRSKGQSANRSRAQFKRPRPGLSTPHPISRSRRCPAG